MERRDLQGAHGEQRVSLSDDLRKRANTAGSENDTSPHMEDSFLLLCAANEIERLQQVITSAYYATDDSCAEILDAEVTR